MNIDRRQLVLPALAIGLVSIVPAIAASADEDAVAKSVEAFRAAQVATDAKAFEALCASELSYGHSDARIEDKATFIANATNQKNEIFVAYLPGHQNSCRRQCGNRAVQLGERK